MWPMSAAGVIAGSVGTGDDDLTRLASVDEVSTFFGPKARMACSGISPEGEGFATRIGKSALTMKTMEPKGRKRCERDLAGNPLRGMARNLFRSPFVFPGRR